MPKFANGDGREDAHADVTARPTTGWRHEFARGAPGECRPYGPMHPWCFAYAFRSGPCRAKNLDHRSHAADRPSPPYEGGANETGTAENRPPRRWAELRRSTWGRGYRRRRTTGTRARKTRAISTGKRVRGAGRPAGKRPGNRVQLRRPGCADRCEGRSNMVRRRRRLRRA